MTRTTSAKAVEVRKAPTPGVHATAMDAHPETDVARRIAALTAAPTAPQEEARVTGSKGDPVVTAKGAEAPPVTVSAPADTVVARRRVTVSAPADTGAVRARGMDRNGMDRSATAMTERRVVAGSVGHAMGSVLVQVRGSAPVQVRASVPPAAVAVVTRSCGPEVGSRHAAIGMRVTSSGSSPKKSGWRESSDPFERVTTIPTFQTMSKRATWTRARGSS
ncbi:MAG TPA: hypothetical protein VGN33_14870 [Leifsonia sp.]|nr:hypothetical protein [Leifsonia sp.]